MTAARRLAGAALGALAVLAAGAGTAQAACPDADASTPFSRWGDPASYVLADGGAFEWPLAWSAQGSPRLVLLNDPFYLSGFGLTSVRVAGRQSITSGPICVNGDRPALRFVARALDRESRLVLEMLWNDAGVEKADVLEEHPADLWRQWAPSKIVPLGDALPTDEGEEHHVRLRFTVKDGIGDWLVDDVFIDPIKRG